MEEKSKSSRQIIVAITGASGAIYGIRTLQMLAAMEIQTHLIISQSARETIPYETGFSLEEVEKLASRCHAPENLSAPVASGSTITHGMVVVPCSIKTLSGIANSYTDNLITRAADVCLKEGRPLLLAVRETPLHAGHIRLMELAAQAGAIIFPPVPAFYGKPQTLDEVVTNTVGRMLQRIGIENDQYSQWKGN